VYPTPTPEHYWHEPFSLPIELQLRPLASGLSAGMLLTRRKGPSRTPNAGTQLQISLQYAPGTTEPPSHVSPDLSSFFPDGQIIHSSWEMIPLSLTEPLRHLAILITVTEPASPLMPYVPTGDHSTGPSSAEGIFLPLRYWQENSRPHIAVLALAAERRPLSGSLRVGERLA
jgi:hypothetical protein